MKKTFRSIVFILSLLLICGFVAAQEANHVVVGEINTDGSGTNEFVELYNPTNQNVDLENWILKRSNSGGTVANLVSSFPNGSIIPAHGFFLIAHPDYNGSVLADLNYTATSNALTNNYAILLYDDNNSLIDLVGWGTCPDFEINATDNPEEINDTIKSLERKSDLIHFEDEGNSYDTGNNLNDFRPRDAEPQNTQSAVEIYGIPSIDLSSLSVNFSEDEKSSVIDFDQYIDDDNTADESLVISYSGNDSVIVSLNQTTHEVQFSALENWFGNDTITFTVSDGENEDDYSVAVIVEAVNDFSILSSMISNITIDEEGTALVNLTPYGFDVETPSEELTWYITGWIPNDETYNVTAEINNITNILSVTGSLNAFGEGSLHVVVTDETGCPPCDSNLEECPCTETASQEINITINPVNDPVVLTQELINFTVQEDTPVAEELSDYASDVEDVVTWTVDSFDDAVFTDVEIIPVGDNSRVLNYELVQDATGTGLIGFTVSDSEGSNLSGQIEITIMSIADGVVLNDLNATNVSEDSVLEYDLTPYIVNVDSLDYNITTDSEHVTVEGNVLSLSYTDETVLSDTITISIDDNLSIVSKELAVTVLVVNDAPVLQDVPDVVMNEDNVSTLDLTSHVSDEDDSVGTLEWSVTPNQNIDVTFVNGVATITPEENYNGASVLVFLVSDGEDQAVDSINVNVTAVQDNPFTPELLYPTNGEELNVSSFILEWNSTGDPDGDSVTYFVYLDNTTSDMELLGTTSLLNYSISLDDLETYYWKVVANDTMQNENDSLTHVAESVVSSFSIEVSTVPVISLIPSSSILANTKYNYDIEASDADGDTLSYSLFNYPTTLAINPFNGSLQWEPSLFYVGVNQIKVRVTDNDEQFDEQEFNLTVVDPFVLEKIELEGEEISEGDIRKVQPGEKLEFDLYFENLFDDRDIETLEGYFVIEGINDSEDFVHELDFTVRSGRTIKETVEFTVPIFAEEEEYEFALVIWAEDDEDYQYVIEKEDMFIEVERQRHYLTTENVEFDKEVVNSSDNITLSFDVLNLGQRVEEGAVISVTSQELGMDERVVVDEILVDDTYEYEKSFEILETVLDGSYSIHVSVSYDDGYKINLYLAQLEVNHINLAPSIEDLPESITLNEDETKQIDLTEYERDLEDSGTSLVWSVSGVDETLFDVEIITTSDLVTIIPVAEQYGNDTVTFTLSDSEGLSVSQDVLVIVDEVDDETEVSKKFPQEESFMISEHGNTEFGIKATDSDSSLTVQWLVDEEIIVNNSIADEGVYVFLFEPENFDVGEHTITARVTDGEVLEESWAVKVVDSPIVETFDGESTDLSTVEDLSDVTDFTLEKSSVGKIRFNENLDLSDVLDLDTHVKIEDGVVAVNSDEYSELEKKATITITGLSFVQTPVIYYTNDFTTDKTKIITLCPDTKCNNVEYVSGVLTFDVTTFSSYAVKDVSTLYSVGVPDSLSLGSDKNDTVKVSFDISNSGSEFIDDLNITSSALSKYNIEFSEDNVVFSEVLVVDLVKGASKKIYVKGSIPDDEESGEHTVGTVYFRNDKISDSMLLKASPDTKLKVDKLEVDVDSDKTKSLHDGGSFTAEPGDTLDFEVKLENTGTLDMEDVFMEVTIEDIDDGDDIDDETQSFDIDSGDEEKESLSLTIPTRLDRDSYDVTIEIEGEDEDGVLHTIQWEIDLKIKKKSHELLIEDNSLSVAKLTCMRRNYLDVKVVNIGKNDEDDVVLKVLNEDLEINVIKRFELEEGDDDDSEKSFTIPIDATDAKAGTYRIDTKAYYDTDRLADDMSVNLIVEECDTITTEGQEGKENAFKVIFEDKKEISSKVITSEEETTILGMDKFLYNVILVSLIIVAIAVILFLTAVIGKKKNKFY